MRGLQSATELLLARRALLARDLHSVAPALHGLSTHVRHYCPRLPLSSGGPQARPHLSSRKLACACPRRLSRTRSPTAGRYV